MTIKKFGTKFTNVANFEDDVYRKPKSMKIIGEIIDNDDSDEEHWSDEDLESIEERENYLEYLAHASVTPK